MAKFQHSFYSACESYIDHVRTRWIP